MSKKTKNIVDKVKWDFIRYANCWEDPDMLLDSLQPNAEHVFSIGSGGDNSFALLLLNPKKISVADINPSQLYLIELKMAAIRMLSCQECSAFLGFSWASEVSRRDIFIKLSDKISEEAKSFFQDHQGFVEMGVIHAGKFESYFRIFAERILPKIHTKGRIDDLLKPKSEADQHAYFTNKWNTWRWKLFFHAFFSRPVMGKFGRDRRLFHEVKINVAKFIKNKADTHLKSTFCQENHLLDYCLKGTFNHLPVYLQEENYDIIKSRLDRLHLINGSLKEAYELNGKFDALNLSNIFEYYDLETFKILSETLYDYAEQGATIAYWNLMVPRSLSTANSDFEEVLLGEQTRAKDKGFFYTQFHCDIKK